MKVLHVEDDEKWREIIERILSEHTMVSVASLHEAKHVYSEQAFDVVICDGNIHTTGDGIRWAEQLNSANQYVIILSGNIPHRTIPFVDKGTADMARLRQLVDRSG